MKTSRITSTRAHYLLWCQFAFFLNSVWLIHLHVLKGIIPSSGEVHDPTHAPVIIPAVYLRFLSCHHHLRHLSLVLMSLLFSCQCVTLPDLFPPSFSLSVSPSLKIVLCSLFQKSLQNFNESHHVSASVSFSSLQEKTTFRKKKGGGGILHWSQSVTWWLTQTLL